MMRGKENIMRSSFVVMALVAAVLLSAGPTAQPSEIRSVALGMINMAGLPDLAAAFTSETGTNVTTTLGVMRNVVENLRTGTLPADVLFLPATAIDELEKSGDIAPGTRIRVCRVDIALAVRPGTPHPDISTVAKLIAVLKASTVLYNNPAGGTAQSQAIDALLKRPEFADVHAVNPARANQSATAALGAGEGDMALHIKSEILTQKAVELVGSLPRELNANVEIFGAVTAKSANPDAARAFLRYVTRPEATAVWAAKGVDRD
jgi:molybdate transport system substrate-binding protein